MEKTLHNKNVIEVKFRDITDAEGTRYTNEEEFIKPKKLSLRLLVTFMQNKAKTVINNKERVVELITKALTFCKKPGNISFL